MASSAWTQNLSRANRVAEQIHSGTAWVNCWRASSPPSRPTLGDWDFRPLLGRLQMPALVVEGAQTNVPLDATREWAATMPNARLLLIPDAGHVHFIEQPAAFFSAAEQFLGGEYPKAAEIVEKRR